MNFIYRLIDVEYVLSQKEHNEVLESVKRGKNNIVLRSGNLMINMAFVRSWNETVKESDLDIKAREDALRLKGDGQFETPPDFYDEKGNYHPQSMNL